VSFESDSNVSDEREEQSAKHSLQRTSTDDGIQTEISEQHLQNALLSIWASFESDSNVTDDRQSQEEKHPLQRISTDDGIQIEFNAEQPKNA
jgi:hypothetical protein